MVRRVLVTGATGYVGSHTVVALIEAGYDVVGCDDFSNSHPAVAARIAEITGVAPAVHRVDLTDERRTRALFDRIRVDAVLHFAGVKTVAESMGQPLRYARTNIGSSMSLLQAMTDAGVERMVFSSSCTVYGEPDESPVDEEAPIRPVNPYGWTKASIERLLADQCSASDLRVRCLRYFNPIGAHPSGLIGEDPVEPPQTLLPNVMRAAAGRIQAVAVRGDDYDTPDGSCIRDFVHVVDVAAGHVAALEALDDGTAWDAFNLGTGVGRSVLEILATAEAVTGRPIPRRVEPRRPGDAAAIHADVGKASEVLAWRAERDLATMCADHWRWEQRRLDRVRVA